MSPLGEKVEIFADGVRNSMGMAFHPVTGDLWFTDNGPSWPFEHPETYDIPADELNRATQPGQHFGFPYIHASLPDPLIGNIAPEGIVGPAHEFQAHTAPLGIKFYTGTMFPEEYRNQAFIAEHGTEATTPVFGVRSRVHGDRITLARFDEASDFVSYESLCDRIHARPEFQLQPPARGPGGHAGRRASGFGRPGPDHLPDQLYRELAP